MKRRFRIEQTDRRNKLCFFSVILNGTRTRCTRLHGLELVNVCFHLNSSEVLVHIEKQKGELWARVFNHVQQTTMDAGLWFFCAVKLELVL